MRATIIAIATLLLSSTSTSAFAAGKTVDPEAMEEVETIVKKCFEETIKIGPNLARIVSKNDDKARVTITAIKMTCSSEIIRRNKEELQKNNEMIRKNKEELQKLRQGIHDRRVIDG